MEATKICNAKGCAPGNVSQQLDIKQAFVQAQLEGNDTWVIIPTEAWYMVAGEGVWQKTAKTFESKPGRAWRPVVKMNKALYGHPDAGALCERYCHKVLLESGFKPIPN